MDALLKKSNIDKYYNGVKALDDVCFEVEKGKGGVINDRAMESEAVTYLQKFDKMQKQRSS